MTLTWTPESEQPKPRTGVDYHEVKAWFQQCRDLTAAIEVQKQKIQRIRDVAEKCTQSLSGMPAGGGNGDKVGFAVEQLDTERRQLQRMETDLCNLRVEAIRRVGNEYADMLFEYDQQRREAEKQCEQLAMEGMMKK